MQQPILLKLKEELMNENLREVTLNQVSNPNILLKRTIRWFSGVKMVRAKKVAISDF
jgi:hypothetical protein